MTIADWGAAQQMVSAARLYFEDERSKLRNLLEQSGERLSPLDDPLRVDFGAHRWLRGKREEAYSDWLEWILNQLKQTEVFKLFGLPSPVAADEILFIRREFPISTEAKKSRKIDIVVFVRDKPQILVEIKKAEADDEAKKLRDYIAWGRSKGISDGYSLLLGTEKKSKEDLCGFRPRRWEDLCIHLRKMAFEMCKKKQIPTGAMILAFVGAVEQNLLRFPSCTEQTDEIQDAFSHDWPRVTRHIRRSLEMEEVMEAEPKPREANEKLLAQGTISYREALLAICAFQKLVLTECRDVVEHNLVRLSNASGLDLKSESLQDYANLPDGTKSKRPSIECPWLAIKVGPKNGPTMYFGLYWNSEKRIAGTLFVMSTLSFENGNGKPDRDRAVDNLKDVHRDNPRTDFDPAELTYCLEIMPTEMASFKDKLADVIGRTAAAFAAVGGINGLLKER
ncbi:MAG: hypothetical protein WBE88_01780 [Candidatus Acidiferrales bacterium]